MSRSMLVRAVLTRDEKRASVGDVYRAKQVLINSVVRSTSGTVVVVGTCKHVAGVAIILIC